MVNMDDIAREGISERMTLKQLWRELRRAAVAVALDVTDGNKTSAAELLGIHRNRLAQIQEEDRETNARLR